MKNLLNWIILTTVCVLMVAKAGATITNADWTFPASTSPGPSQPIAADLATFSINDFLGWTAAGSHLNETFVSNPGKTTALEFSYNGNQASSLNGSTLTLTNTISGLATGFSLTGIQLSYDTKWSNTGNTVKETWAYSLNGGTFLNFQTNTVTGSAWLTTDSPLTGLLLQDGDTIAFRDTFSGATGNGQSLDFDNILITSAGSIEGIAPVPEPSSLALAAMGISLAGLRFVSRLRPSQTR
jgi:PEP-CTERM motif